MRRLLEQFQEKWKPVFRPQLRQTDVGSLRRSDPEAFDDEKQTILNP
jgi:hypothetical protein